MQISVTTQKTSPPQWKLRKAELAPGSCQCNRSCSRYPPSCHVVSQTAKHRRSKNTVKTFDALLLLGKNTEFQKSLPWKGPWLIKKHDTRKRPAGYPSCLRLFMRGLRFRSTQDFGLWSKICRPATDTEASTRTRTRTRTREKKPAGYGLEQSLTK